jgi:hypothetical protein
MMILSSSVSHMRRRGGAAPGLAGSLPPSGKILANIDARDGRVAIDLSDTVCSFDTRPFRHYLRPGQEHGRTIPLKDLQASLTYRGAERRAVLRTQSSTSIRVA